LEDRAKGRSPHSSEEGKEGMELIVEEREQNRLEVDREKKGSGSTREKKGRR